LSQRQMLCKEGDYPSETNITHRTVGNGRRKNVSSSEVDGGKKKKEGEESHLKSHNNKKHSLIRIGRRLYLRNEKGKRCAKEASARKSGDSKK